MKDKSSLTIINFYDNFRKHVSIGLENSPKSHAQNWQKSTQIELEFLKKCLKFRNSARKLLVVINYFLADVHKYSSFIKALTIDFPIGDQTTSEKPTFFFFKIDCSHGQNDFYAFS